MCLAIPAKVISVTEGDTPQARTGIVDLQGSQLETSLALTPDAGEGDWVLVHAGFAIQQLSEKDAQETWEYLEEYLEDPRAQAEEYAGAELTDEPPDSAN